MTETAAGRERVRKESVKGGGSESREDREQFVDKNVCQNIISKRITITMH